MHHEPVAGLGPQLAAEDLERVVVLDGLGGVVALEVLDRLDRLDRVVDGLLDRGHDLVDRVVVGLDRVEGRTLGLALSGLDQVLVDRLVGRDGVDRLAGVEGLDRLRLLDLGEVLGVVLLRHVVLHQFCVAVGAGPGIVSVVRPRVTTVRRG